MDDILAAVDASGNVPVYLGSGASAETLRQFVPPAYGAIAGTSLKLDGRVEAPIDEGRVRSFALAMKSGNLIEPSLTQLQPSRKGALP